MSNNDCTCQDLLCPAISCKTLITSPPKVTWEERVATPTLENALSHVRVLAEACTMHNEALRSIAGALQSSYGTLQKISILSIINLI